MSDPASSPPRSPSAMFRAVGGTSLMLSTAFDRAKAKAVDEFAKRNALYRWDLSDAHVALLAQIAASITREAIADVAFELRQQFINATATADDFDSPTRETMPALPVQRRDTDSFGKVKP